MSDSLVTAIGRLLLGALRNAVIAGTRVYFLELLLAWNLPRQSALSHNIPGALRISFNFFLHVNDGRSY